MIPTEIYALAEAWASIDGKGQQFHDPMDDSGTFDGYIAEAYEMQSRLNKRGYGVMALASPVLDK